jgi:hypothetical protein
VQLYRRLRENYEANKRYSEAGDFFVGEMEVLRKYKTMQTIARPKTEQRITDGEGKKIQRQTESTEASATLRVVKRPITDPYRLILELYRLLAMYGESIKRPTVASFVTIGLFACVRLLLTPEININQILSTFVMTMKDSIFSFFQLGGGGDIDRIERLVSPFILGLLFITLRRRLERR